MKKLKVIPAESLYDVLMACLVSGKKKDKLLAGIKKKQ